MPDMIGSIQSSSTEIGLGLGDAGQGFLAIPGFLDTEALFFQIVAQHCGERRFILHNQNKRLRQAGYTV